MNEERKHYCSACEEWKPHSEFFRKYRNDPESWRGPCKACYRAIYTPDYRRLLAEAKS